ncbi:centromere protein V-like [Mytilus galloprovincialis]|uniref:centromere protein V-like n=1 Tax=Mytilus galloprovincialis TaxID=29158 RepID=UPI003F7B52CC
MADDLVAHSGSCHCGAVKFEVVAEKVLHVYDCNCSICKKKQNKHFVVPKSRFKLLQGADNITTYTFNSRKAQHTFCKTCGVQSFYTPRSNPDGYGIAPHCIDSNTIERIEEEKFDGQNWDQHIEKSGIRQRSKE